MKIKKSLILTFMLLSFVQLYSFEYSLGATLGGAGLGVLRDNNKNLSSVTEYFIPDDLISIYSMFEFIDYFALETTLGLNLKSYESMARYSAYGSGGISLGLLVRGQYEFERVLIYGSIGPRIIIDYIDEHAPPKIDWLFVFGVETRLGDANYLGVRIGYSLATAISKNDYLIYDTPSSVQPGDMYLDALSFSLTYRYAFNSKHKKTDK